MDTQANNHFFELIFYQKEKTIPLSRMGTVEDFFDENAVVVTENMELSIFFNSPDSNAKLYLAGLELLDISKVDENGNYYLDPMNEIRMLFQNFNTHYPLIPGFYPIKIVVYGNNIYSTLRIEPKQITHLQWEYMKDELENELKGLAQDFIRNKYGIGYSVLPVIPVHLLYQFELVMKNYNQILISLKDIELKPRYKLKKEYKLTWISRARQLDERSLKYKLTHPDKNEIVSAPINKIDYNLLENRWLKKILSSFVQLLTHFINAVDISIDDFEEDCKQLKRYINKQNNTRIQYNEKKKTILILSEFRDKARLMKRNFIRFSQSDWLNNVSVSDNDSFTNILNMDSRYRVIYQLYRELTFNQFNISIESSFASQWKKTDLLYEIWGYMQVCKALINLGYQPKSGWLFSYTKNLFVPTLKPGTRVIFKKGDLTLQLVYNEPIPRDEKDTDLDNNPLFAVGTHNCPDGRLDVYKENVYIGSLIFDMKYRQLDSVWRIDTRVINQLTDYSLKTKSLFIYGDLVSKRMKYRRYQPAHVVWGIYPSKDLNLEKRSQKHLDGIVHLLRLCPGDDLFSIGQELEDVIDNMLQDYYELLHD